METFLDINRYSLKHRDPESEPTVSLYHASIIYPIVFLLSEKILPFGEAKVIQVILNLHVALLD
jgi:hypothetical protein